MPVHSSATSMPSSRHGSGAGSFTAVTLMAPLPQADGVALDRHLAGKAAVHGIEAQQMRVGLDRRQIVHRDDFDVVTVGLDHGAQDIAADAAESIDGDANRHSCLPVSLGCRPDRAATLII